MGLLPRRPLEEEIIFFLRGVDFPTLGLFRLKQVLQTPPSGILLSSLSWPHWEHMAFLPLPCLEAGLLKAGWRAIGGSRLGQYEPMVGSTNQWLVVRTNGRQYEPNQPGTNQTNQVRTKYLPCYNSSPSGLQWRQESGPEQIVNLATPLNKRWLLFIWWDQFVPLIFFPSQPGRWQCLSNAFPWREALDFIEGASDPVSQSSFWASLVEARLLELM
jgi:hypothetical protein